VTLIVVSGAPGTGKSTIAAALGAALRFPVLSLDPIKEALADVLGLAVQDLLDEVVQDEPMAAREGLDEAGDVAPAVGGAGMRAG